MYAKIFYFMLFLEIFTIFISIFLFVKLFYLKKVLSRIQKVVYFNKSLKIEIESELPNAKLQINPLTSKPLIFKRFKSDLRFIARNNFPKVLLNNSKQSLFKIYNVNSERSNETWKD